MSLVYCFVARGTTVLAEYAAFAGRFNSIAIECLKNQRDLDKKWTIVCDKHTFNFLSGRPYTYLVVADESYGRAIPFAFLERLRDQFQAAYGDKAATASANSFTKEFRPKMKELMEDIMAHPESVNKVLAVQQQVDQVKDIVTKNVELVIQRGEKLDVLIDKADDLNAQADIFQKNAVRVRKKFWWQQFRMQLIIALIIVILAVIIFLLVCFTGGQSCFSKNK